MAAEPSAAKPTSHTPTRRLSGDDRRRQLVDVAMRLFSRRGFTGTTTREIAVAAGVTEALIFRFFPRKEDLYAAILERKSGEAGSEAWVEGLRAAAARCDDRAVIRGVVRHLLEHRRRDPEFLRLMLYSALEGHSLARQYRERHFSPLRRFIVEYVAERQAAGVFRAGDPRRLARAIIGLPAHDGLVETLTPDAKIAGDDAVDLYTEFILAGLQAVPRAASRAKVRRA